MNKVGPTHMYMHTPVNTKLDFSWLINTVSRQLESVRPCLVLKIFQDSSSHRIFGRMHGALNIDENKN